MDAMAACRRTGGTVPTLSSSCLLQLPDEALTALVGSFARTSPKGMLDYVTPLVRK